MPEWTAVRPETVQKPQRQQVGCSQEPDAKLQVEERQTSLLNRKREKEKQRGPAEYTSESAESKDRPWDRENAEVQGGS